MKTILGIFLIASLLFFSLSQGIDGALLATGIAIIAGLGGFTYGTRHRKS